jgi:hypothetical protein
LQSQCRVRNNASTRYRATDLLFVATLLLLVPTAVYAQANLSGVVINEVLYDPNDNSGANDFDTDGDGSIEEPGDEFVELYNTSGSTVDISGWSLWEDGSSAAFTFPGAPGSNTTTIAPGGYVVVVEEYTPTPIPAGFFESGSLSLGNSGENVYLCDASNQYVEVSLEGATDTNDLPCGGGATQVGSTEDFGTGEDGLSVQRFPDGSTNIVSTTPTPVNSNLPVELTAFEALVDGEAVELRWTTASETNNAGFEVQHLSGGASARPANLDLPHWDVLTWVEGHGTTAEPQTYRVRTEPLTPGTHRFRLRQVDFDGTFAYSPEVEVAVGLPVTHRLTAPYPNPFTSEARFSLAVATAQHVRLAAYDLLGREVARLFDARLPAHSSRAFQLDATDLPSGTYVLRAVGETFTTSRTVTLLR